MSEQEIIAQLAAAERSVLVAAAGCGKTHAIAQAVALSTGKPQLILTHTHAGVAALRRRFVKLGVSRSRYKVETIASWSLKLAASYPATSRLPVLEPGTNAEWQAVSPAAEAVVQLPAIRRVLQASYGGVYVDEYQDCTLPQHKLVLALADTLPCRILGDPLQGIFEFTGEAIDWNRDVLPAFNVLPELRHPWRWHEGNVLLGTWLMRIRDLLLADQSIDLTGAPITWMPLTPKAQHKACNNYLGKRDETVVALLPWEAGCHHMAKSLQGRYKSMEAIECPDLMTYAKLVQQSSGAKRVLTCIAFAKKCLSNLGPSTNSLEKSLQKGSIPRTTAPAKAKLYQAAAIVLQSQSFKHVRALFQTLKDCPDTHLYREELWSEMMRAITFTYRSDSPDLGKAAWQVRDITRQNGRSERFRLVSRTLLVKGLEYDHALILDGDKLDKKNLYVALTRPKRSLIILSDSPKLSPYKSVLHEPESSTTSRQ